MEKFSGQAILRFCTTCVKRLGMPLPARIKLKPFIGVGGNFRVKQIFHTVQLAEHGFTGFMYMICQ